jgi:hypothetical protein
MVLRRPVEPARLLGMWNTSTPYYDDPVSEDLASLVGDYQ